MSIPNFKTTNREVSVTFVTTEVEPVKGIAGYSGSGRIVSPRRAVFRRYPDGDLRIKIWGPTVKADGSLTAAEYEIEVPRENTPAWLIDMAALVNPQWHPAGGQ